MAAAEADGTPAAKAAYDAIIRHLWGKRLISAVKVSQLLGVAPDVMPHQSPHPNADYWF